MATGVSISALRDHPPMDFQQIRKPGWDTDISSAWTKIGDDLMVLCSQSVEADGRMWFHVSMSRPTRLPTWQDVRRVKDAFIGKDQKAVQVFPPQSEYVNIHPHVLHLFHCMDGDVLPDFRRGTGL